MREHHFVGWKQIAGVTGDAYRVSRVGSGKYSYDAVKVLQRVWAASGGQCGKYLAESMPVLLEALKNERVHRTVYATKAQATRDVIMYIEGFYNSRRRHSALGYQRPNEV